MELNPDYKRTEIGAIPEEWNLPLLDSVAKRGSGHTPDKKHPEYWNGPIKWVSLKDCDALDNLYIEDTAATITSAGIKHSSAVIHPAGTVILSRDAGVGKSAITKDDMAVSQHFMAWQCGPRLDNHFLYYWLQAAKPEFERIAIGNTIKTIGLPYFRALRVPCPPLAEQRAIAAALEDVDALQDSLARIIAKKRDVKKSAMQQLLTGQTRLPCFCIRDRRWKQSDVGSIPDDWSEAPLQSVTLKIQDGAHFSPRTGGHDFLYVTSRNIGFGRLDVSDAERIDAAQHQHIYARCDVRMGDVLLTKDGANTGNAALNILHEQFSLLSSVAFLRFDPTEFSPPFFLYQILSDHGQQRIKQLTSGNAITRLTLRKIRWLSFAFPALEEQTAIAAVLSDMDAELAGLEQRLAKTRALKQGMMQELLTGRTRLV